MYGTSDGIQIHDEIHPEAPRQRGQFDRRGRRTENSAIRTTQYSNVRSVTCTTVYIPGSLAGAHLQALTRRRSRQRAQRPANGRPERRRGLAYTRERARSLVALDGGTDALDARRPAARLPAALAEQLVDREVPGLGGRLKEPLPCRPRYGTGSGTRRELAKYRHESQSWVAK